MKKHSNFFEYNFLLLLLFVFSLFFTSCDLFLDYIDASTYFDNYFDDNNASAGEDNILSKKKQVLQNYYNTELKARANEFKNNVVTLNGVTMKYEVIVKWSDDGSNKRTDTSPMPLYICLHGGGNTTTANNDQEWLNMGSGIYYGFIKVGGGYYRNNGKRGVYVNPRAIEDTYDCHSRPMSYPLYDRLITTMKIFEKQIDSNTPITIDLNKVYILGFSAGGNGVYQVAPHMPDRFAAANMSAGHPEDINVENLYNLPILLQVGMNDTSYERNKLVAQYDKKLADCSAKYNGGYTHIAYIHKDKPHNFDDNVAFSSKQTVVKDPISWLKSGYSNDYATKQVSANAVYWTTQYTRNPLPEKVVWDLSTRANRRSVKSNYWLSADYSVNRGIVVASYNKSTNTITISENTANGDITILLNEKMIDFNKDVTIKVLGKTYSIAVSPSMDILTQTTAERGDENYQFLAKINLSELANYNI